MPALSSALRHFLGIASAATTIMDARMRAPRAGAECTCPLYTTHPRLPLPRRVYNPNHWHSPSPLVLDDLSEIGDFCLTPQKGKIKLHCLQA